jgi:bifunctional non-homologous end joining protein LigD
MSGVISTMTKPPRPPRSKPLLLDGNAPLQGRRVRKRDPAQPNLALDPMPARVEPALAVLKARPPTGPDWGWEIKWDGYRLAAHIEPGGVRLLTRGGYNWVDRFPAIADACRALGPATMILDGEAVVLDEQGRSDFGALQNSLGAVGRRSGNLISPAMLYAFDLLYLDGRDLRGLEYRARRHLLEGVLQGYEGAIRLSEEIDADPVQLLDHACRLGLEGIVGKNRNSPYRSGKTGDWLKFKCVQSEGFLIVGYEPAMGSPGGFGALLLAAYDGNALAYVGSVGTGFKRRDAEALREQFDRLPWKRKTPPIPYRGKRNVVWLKPTLIAEVEYRAWTTDRKLRHAAYKRLRDVQDNATVYRL